MTIQESNDRIIELLNEGKTHKEIAAELFMQLRTVENRLKRLREKHGCVTTVQLVSKLTAEKRITQNHYG